MIYIKQSGILSASKTANITYYYAYIKLTLSSDTKRLHLTSYCGSTWEKRGCPSWDPNMVENLKSESVTSAASEDNNSL